MAYDISNVIIFFFLRNSNIIFQQKNLNIIVLFALLQYKKEMFSISHLCVNCLHLHVDILYIFILY